MTVSSSGGLEGWPRASKPAPPRPLPGAGWPRISLVTPSRNQGRYIEATLLSVLHQGYPDLEYIVMDGASSDGTAEILKRYSSSLAYWESTPDRGQAHAINKGWKRAAGKYLGWLNADDLLAPGSLFTAAALLEGIPETDMVYGDTYLIDQDGEIVGATRYEEFDFDRFLLNRLDLPQAGALVRRSALDRVGFLDEDLHYLMDYDFWIRLALAGGKFARSPQPLALFRLHEEGKTEAGSLRSVEERRLIHTRLRDDPRLPPAVRRGWSRVTGLMHFECARTAIRAGEFSAGLADVSRAVRSWPPVLLRPALVYQAGIAILGLGLGRGAWVGLRERVRRARRRRARPRGGQT
jgi:glycosyltransferase involved in cell wall biosynthesis